VLHVPAQGLEARGHVLREGDLGVAVNGDPACATSCQKSIRPMSSRPLPPAPWTSRCSRVPFGSLLDKTLSAWGREKLAWPANTGSWRALTCCRRTGR
jgi:hypothetical protein